MQHYITHPTKEQVREYMHRRETDQSPPPTPEEIRRQLGWFIGTEPHCSGKASLVFPVTIGQLSVLLALEWLFRLGAQPGVRGAACAMAHAQVHRSNT